MSPLSKDHRPRTLDEFFGNASLKSGLLSKLNSKDRPSCYMFSGDAGCGKTTLARITARELGCDSAAKGLQIDYREYDIGDARGIDDARKIKENLLYAPANGPVKVYCLDEVQGATLDFKQSLLKVAEEPPGHVVFILCTTDPQKLMVGGKKTFLRRFEAGWFEVKPLSDREMLGFLLHSLAREGVATDGYPPEILAEVTRQAGGSPGIALSILDRIIDMGDFDQIMEVIRRSGADEASAFELARAINARNWAGCVAELSKMADKGDVEGVRHIVLGYMRKVLLGRNPTPHAYHAILHFERPFYDSGLAGLTRACYGAVAGLKPGDIPF